MFGEINYNKTPIVPPGTRILAHHKSTNQPTWAPTGNEGWYIVPSMNHYQCLIIIPPITAGRDFGPVNPPPPTIVSFSISHNQRFSKQAPLDIISILTNPLSSLTVTLESGDDIKDALLKIAETLQRIKSTPILSTLPLSLTLIPSTKTTPMPFEENYITDTALLRAHKRTT